ncbi:Uncharacterised protein [Faecalibacterium prausnitzii]|nr:Uncharacterised protein [Faecalibacterium prausnitzii]
MITQADSRKWMARLYNSFLFMEAKIMKMAKKLLALVLTGVMAVSMLTGCALTDAAKAKAMEKALNDHAQGNTQTIKYDYKSSLNSKADKIWEENFKDDSKTVTENTLTAVALKNVANKGYFYYIVEQPKNDVKTYGAWVTDATALHNEVKNKVDTKSSAASFDKIMDHKTSTDPKAKSKVEFGVSYVSKTVKNGQDTKTTKYAVIVFEAAPKA